MLLSNLVHYKSYINSSVYFTLGMMYDNDNNYSFTMMGKIHFIWTRDFIDIDLETNDYKKILNIIDDIPFLSHRTYCFGNVEYDKNYDKMRNAIPQFIEEVACRIIQKQLKQSMYNPAYKMCRSIMLKNFDEVK